MDRFSTRATRGREIQVQKSSPPYDRYASAAVVFDGLIHLIGGTGPSPETPLRYDPALDVWTTLAPMSERRDHVGAIVLDDRIHALSGRDPNGSNHTSVEIYDPATDTWIPGPAMNEGRSGFAAVVLDDRIYVAGGELIVDPIHTLDSVEALDRATNTWSYVHAMPEPVHGCGGVAALDRIWLFGGATEALSATPHDGTVYVYWP